MFIFRICTVLVALAVLSGCASLTSTGSQQVVLVRSEPEGAKVRIGGQDVAVTPAFVMIDRSHAPRFSIRDDDGDHEIELRSHYRWIDSFLSNFIFYTAAPVGWLVDVISGAAWRSDEPPLIPVHLAVRNRRRKLAAIAPPQSAFALVSDAGGEAVERNLRAKLGSAAVLSYRETLERFLANGYDFDGRPGERDMRNLYGALGVDTIYESTANFREHEDDILLQVKKVGVYDNTESDAFSLTLQPEGGFESIFTSRHWWTRLIPNTVALSWAREQLQLVSGGQTYDLNPAGENTWWANGLNYLNAVDITNTLPRRAGHARRWEFGFIPTFRLSRKVVRASGLVDEGDGMDEIFTRWWVSAGYGPELGYQIGRHYLYADLIPYFYWNEISWAENQIGHSETGTGLQLGLELGYLVTFNDHWLIRFFSRSENEDGHTWAQALKTRLPAGASDSLQAQTVVLGLSFGYRFEPEFDAKRWLRK